jgi:2-amino-4-hydroxy-6-hydroxymethyldihydropteridine diphosphokinase
MESLIYIAVGSNIDPEDNVVRALEFLLEEINVSASSTFFWSAPAERPDQELFLNGVWQAQTARTPREIKFDILRPIEHRLGRRREADSHAARTIDLDLALYGDLQVGEKDLQLPDPDIPKRAFLWQPLAELASASLATLGFEPLPQALEGLAPNPQITGRLRSVLDSSPGHPRRKADI